MILYPTHKIGTLLLTFQKKKLYYNRISELPLYLSLRVLTYFCYLVQLTIEQNWMTIKRSFLIFIIVISFMTIIQNQTLIPIYDTNSGKNTHIQIQSEKQALNIPNPKKDLTPFYQFKSKHAKNYMNTQQEVYRSIVYTKNLQKINKNNQKVDRKYNTASNSFADLTAAQFSEIHTSLFSSNQQIKGYAKKYIDNQNLNSSTSLGNFSDTKFMQNHQDDVKNLKDTLNRQFNNRKSYVSNENPEFSILQQIFASSNPNSQLTDNKNKQLSNYFNSYLINYNISSLNLAGLNKNASAQVDAYYTSLQQQFNKILQTNTYAPLKLTTDTSLSTATSTSTITTSTTGNFSLKPIDWTVHAGAIRYQGVCGACYTFATSDVVGSLYSIYKFGFFVPLSTQQVVDCSTNGLTYGCNGGFLQGSYAYMQIKGIQTDSNYPYTSAVSGVAGSCKKDGGTFKVASFKNIEQGNCKALVNQLNYGPVSIGIAGYRLQFYSTGIFNDCNSYIDHAVVLISYKSGTGWKIKNSWGSSWGMNGFAWIADGNNCGICNMAVSARI